MVASRKHYWKVLIVDKLMRIDKTRREGQESWKLEGEDSVEK